MAQIDDAFFDVLSAHGINPAGFDKQQPTNTERSASDNSYIRQTLTRQTYFSR